MVKQYPHFLFRQTADAQTVQDDKGNWVTGTLITNTFLSICRQEADGRGTEYKVADGTFHKSTSLIQCPKGCPNIIPGETVVIANDMECTDIRTKGVCLNFNSAQMHARLWL